MNMMWKKRVVQSSVVAVSLVTVATAAAFGTAGANKAVVAGYRTAGIVTTVNGMEASAYAADVQASDVTVVAKAQDKNPEWSNRLMAEVDEFLYVRAEADADGDIVGKIRKGDVAEVTGEENGWYQITSGNVNGFVSADYCVVGDEAYELANEVCTTYAKATEGGIRVRSTASADGDILTVMAQGDSLVVDTDAKEVDGWVAVVKNGETGYVSSDYVEVAMEMGTAITLEEEQAAIEAKKAAEAAAKKEATATQNAAVAASCDDVTLLAAIIQCEAGNECYEGQVAVGAVIVNRLRSGGYPSDLYGVIFQRGQFTPAASGMVASVVASGPKGSCIQAAQQALSGYDNTGGALSFRPVSSGRGGVVIGNHVFF